jgi:hypothetical protein
MKRFYLSTHSLFSAISPQVHSPYPSEFYTHTNFGAFDPLHLLPNQFLFNGPISSNSVSPFFVPLDFNSQYQTPSSSAQHGPLYPNQAGPSDAIPFHALSPLHSPSTTSDSQLFVTAPNAVNELAHRHELARKCFPNQDMESVDLKNRLLVVLNSTWFNENTLEPENELRTFIRAVEPNRFQCTAWNCTKQLPKSSRLIDHFRTHINHRPYKCDGCAKANWYV